LAVLEVATALREVSRFLSFFLGQKCEQSFAERFCTGQVVLFAVSEQGFIRLDIQPDFDIDRFRIC
jgi:hypothetical protein